MEKFLNIPVTNEQKQIVSILDVKLVEQATTSSVTLAYGSGKVVTINHAATASGSEAMRQGGQQFFTVMYQALQLAEYLSPNV